MHNWVAEFRKGSKSLEDDLMSGRSGTDNTEVKKKKTDGDG